MKAWGAAYLASLALFVAIDLAWITQVMQGLFKRHLGSMLVAQPRLGAAVAFYLIYAAGVMLLAVWPADERLSWKLAAGLGAALGFVAYATYDLTNRATLEAWPLSVALIDIAWGTALTALAALAGYHALQAMK